MQNILTRKSRPFTQSGSLLAYAWSSFLDLFNVEKEKPAVEPEVEQTPHMEPYIPPQSCDGLGTIPHPVALQELLHDPFVEEAAKKQERGITIIDRGSHIDQAFFHELAARNSTSHVPALVVDVFDNPGIHEEALAAVLDASKSRTSEFIQASSTFRIPKKKREKGIRSTQYSLDPINGSITYYKVVRRNHKSRVRKCSKREHDRQLQRTVNKRLTLTATKAQ